MRCETAEGFHHPSVSKSKAVRGSRRTRRPGRGAGWGSVFLEGVSVQGGHTHGIPRSTEEEGNLEQSPRVGKAGVRSSRCLPESAGL